MKIFTNDLFSPQYKGACWEIFDDTVVHSDDRAFIERYVMVVLLFTPEQDIGELHMKTCGLGGVS